MKKILSLVSLLVLSIVGVSAQTSVTATIPSTITDGTSYYTTFSSASALDFSEVEGLKAYVVESLTYDNNADGGFGGIVANLEEVGKVPANTGLLLVGTEAKDYTIPVATGTVTLDVENLLIAVGADVNSYTLTNPFRLDGEEFIGEYYVYFSSPYNQTLVAGTAYLSLTNSEVDDAGGYVYLNFTSSGGGDGTPSGVYENIAALKAAAESGDATVKLVNALVTYVGVAHDDYYGTDQESIVIEDATGAFLLQDAGLSDIISTGDILNGTLNLKVISAWGTVSFTGSSTTLTSSLMQGSGTVTPLDLTDDETLLDYLGNSEWRLAKFSGATVSVQHGTWSDDVYLYLKEMEDKFPIQDLLGTNVEIPADGAKVNVVGYIYEVYGIQAFQPVSIEVLGFPVKIGPARYATYVTPVDIDFSLTDGVTAYAAKAGTNSVTLTEVTAAPAGTPLVLKAGAEGEYTLKSATTTPATVTDNDLTAGPATGDASSQYVLGKQGGNVGFGLLATGVELGAANAYIPATKFSGARGFYPFFFGDVTAIEAVKSVAGSNAVFNLNGQRVSQPGKGLYIVNGRKVVVK